MDDELHTQKNRDASTSIDRDELAKFASMADEWWDPKGKFRPLHKFNPVRLGFIRESVEEHFSLEKGLVKPFEGLQFLDIGCGGGLVSEPLARLGAKVTAIDAEGVNVQIAKAHLEGSELEIDYRVSTVEELLPSSSKRFDVVVCLEVVEHVNSPHQFLKDAGSIVAPNGMIIIATINRTSKAFVFAIVGAEYVLRWLPRGTHQFEKLVTPQEVRSAFEEIGLQVEQPRGVSFNPLTDSWRLSTDTQVNYMQIARNRGGNN